MRKRRTHDDYVAEVKEVSPQIWVVGQFVNMSTKILHHCLEHDIYWYAYPDNIIKGHGCKQCGIKIAKNKRSKTHKQYIDELKNISPDIIVLEKYNGANTPIKHKCLIDGYEWNAKPNNILHSKGCPMCAGNIKWDHSKYIEEVSKISPSVQVLGTYIDRKTHILHKCKMCGYEWMTSPASILTGSGCPICGRKRNADMRRKSHDQYVHELSIVNSDVIAIERYQGALTPILHKCLIDGYEWKTAPSNLLSGAHCPMCSNCVRRTPQEYVAEVKIVNPNIEVMGEFINMTTPILHRCKTHDITWNAYPYCILRGSGCKLCGNQRISDKFRKPREQYTYELSQVNPTIELIEEYINSNTPIKHRCLIDGYEWDVAPRSLLAGTGCPKCKQSHGEKYIHIWLDNHHIPYQSQKRFDDCRDKRKLPFDFYLPTYNSIIQYDGKQHFTPVDRFGGQEGFEKCNLHDRIKNDYCRQNNITLLRIQYDQDIDTELTNFLLI